MDEIDLAKLFIRLSELRTEAAGIEKQISDAVLERKKSFNLAGVEATYYKAGREYDYEKAAKDAKESGWEFDINLYTTNVPKIQWKALVTDLKITDIPFTDKPERVIIK